jgi:hypothetical protein
MTELATVVEDFATAFTSADASAPGYVSRTGRQYQPGLGPYAEDAAVRLILAAMRINHGDRYGECGQQLRHPGSRQACDLWIGSPVEWVAEVKMARFFGDNGRPDDTSLKDILSPYPAHRSALTDSLKLATSTLPGRKAMIVYGFDYPTMTLDPAIEAFEALATRSVAFSPRLVARLERLVHPVHREGRVFGWEVLGRR